MLYQKVYALAVTLTLLLPLHDFRVENYSHRLRNSTPRGPATAGADLEIVRLRVIRDLLAPPVDEVLVMDLIKSIRPDGSWPGINYADVSRTGFEHARHLENMFQLSRAYKKADSQWYQNPQVKDAALSALDYWLENDFICDNWWWNEMGTP